MPYKTMALADPMFSLLKAMLHEALFLATCNTTDVALVVARKRILM